MAKGISGFDKNGKSKKDSYNLSGTKKQIDYAKDIIASISDTMKSYEEKMSSHPMIGQLKEMHKTVLKNMENGYAGDIIDDFRDIMRKDTTDAKYRDIVNAIEVSRKTKKRDYRKK